MSLGRHTADVNAFRQRLHAASAGAFDAAAQAYDANFSATRLGRLLRQRVWDTLACVFQPGQRILELGCGTGEDAVFLARRGVSVLATDPSAGMLGVAQAKAREAGLLDRVRFAQMDAARLALPPAAASAKGDVTTISAARSMHDPALPAGRRMAAASAAYDGALADFGVLNCVGDRAGLGSRLAERLRPGAIFVAVVMGPLCVWELGWYALHGDLARATRRWRSGALASVGQARLRVWYPSAGRLRRELSAAFELRKLVGLGTLLPPSYLSHLVDRWPRVFNRLADFDARVPGGPWLADHYVAVFERR
jgi:SAM-dependent methyltransferase